MGGASAGEDGFGLLRSSGGGLGDDTVVASAVVAVGRAAMAWVVCSEVGSYTLSQKRSDADLAPRYYVISQESREHDIISRQGFPFMEY